MTKLILAFLLSFGASAQCPVCPVCPGSPPPAKPLRDLWVWQSGVASDPAQQASFFKFAALHAVRNVHIECEGLIQTGQAALASFLTAAAAKNIGVYCLFANSTWALTANQPYAVNLTTLAAKFKAANPLLLGVDYDVEPDWGTNPASVQSQYVALVQKIKAAAGTMPVMMTIGYWWYGNGYMVTINGVTKDLDKWILDYADIAIMDFYNTSTRIVSGMYTIDHAQTAKRKALVGLLMEQDTQYTYTSFYSYFFPTPSSGETYLEKQMTDSAASFMSDTKKNQAFNGFILEDYKWYLQAYPL